MAAIKVKLFNILDLEAIARVGYVLLTPSYSHIFIRPGRKIIDEDAREYSEGFQSMR